jgi:Leucine-rich repeat (LRR) protein
MLKNSSNVLIIDFQCNEITEIEDGSFGDKRKLEKIDLMGNRLTRITKDIFSGNLAELREINLSFNNINGIESKSFEKFSNLISIDLSHNFIKHVHSKLFEKSKYLRKVFIHHNMLLKIECNVFYHDTKLKRLDVSYNNLNYIPQFEIGSIRHYDISYNNITELNLNYDRHVITKIGEIEELKVANNQINKCVKLHRTRTDIIHLDIEHNELNNFNELPYLLNLEYLQLSHNNISKLCLNSFEERFPSMRTLNISVNSLSCMEYQNARNILPHIAIIVDMNLSYQCHNNDSTIDHDDNDADVAKLDSKIMSVIQTSYDEIVWQLKLNRLLFIIFILSLFIMFVTIRAFILLHRHNHCRYCCWCAIKQTKGNLIEQIEL